MQLQGIDSLLGFLRQQRKVEALNRCRSFNSQFLADALFFFKAFNFMTTRATVLFD